ncbi:MAG TPA: transporter substrate-binding domain-containing protein [Hyphomicrobiaceae bacterium]|jgi:polar amino acid transport system substrate-binding protein
MKRPFQFLAAVLSVLLLAGVNQVVAQEPDPDNPASDQGARRLVLRFVTDGDFPPFNYFDEDGILTGFNIDLARALCLEANTSCDIQARPWDTLIPALERGDADAVIAGHRITPQLLQTVDFTERYFRTPARFAARRDSEKIEISPEELDGKSIAVAKGTAHSAYLKAFFRFSKIREYDSPEQAREAVMNGKADFVFDDGIGLSFWVVGTISHECCELRGGAYYEPKYFGDGLAIAVSKRDPNLKHLLNDALKRVRASGRYEELVLRYFPNRVY